MNRRLTSTVCVDMGVSTLYARTKITALHTFLQSVGPLLVFVANKKSYYFQNRDLAYLFIQKWSNQIKTVEFVE